MRHFRELHIRVTVRPVAVYDKCASYTCQTARFGKAFCPHDENNFRSRFASFSVRVFARDCSKHADMVTQPTEWFRFKRVVRSIRSVELSLSSSVSSGDSLSLLKIGPATVAISAWSLSRRHRPKEFGGFIAGEVEKWGNVIRSVGIRVD